MYPCIPTHRLLYALPWRYTSFVSALTGDAGIRHPAHAYCLSPHPPGDAGIRYLVHAYLLPWQPSTPFPLYKKLRQHNGANCFAGPPSIQYHRVRVRACRACRHTRVVRVRARARARARACVYACVYACLRLWAIIFICVLLVIFVCSIVTSYLYLR